MRPERTLRIVKGALSKAESPRGMAYTGGDDGDPPMTDYVTHAEFTDAMHRIDGRFAKVDERFARIEARLDQTATKEDVASVKAEIHRGIVETQRWMIATVVGLFIGFGGLFMAMTNALKPGAAPAPVAAQPPVIINIPSPAQAPPAAAPAAPTQ